MANMPFRDRTARDILIVTGALSAMFALGGSASAAFLINCKQCHTVPQNGMVIINFQTTTNVGAGLYKVFQVSPGQTAVIELSVTNGHGGNYGLNINNLGAGGVNSSSDHMDCTADPTWTSYFPGTTTNFFMAGPASTSPNLWTFNLVVKTNTPADFYTINSQMAGYDAASEMWSQQESFYVQVVAAAPLAPTILAPQWSGGSFSVQVATISGFTYYLEYKTDLTATTWTATAQTPGDGTSKTLTDTMANGAQRFYHVRVQ
jgi:hypothetical protein